MWLLLVNFLSFALNNVLRAVIIKFVIFTAIVLLVAGLAVFVINALVDFDMFGIGNLFQALPDGLIFFLEVFEFDIGLPLIIGGFVARFTIRRLPFIG